VKEEPKEGKEQQGQQEKKPYHKRKQYKERIEVTLETVIEELPKKAERLAEPSDDTYYASLDEV